MDFQIVNVVYFETRLDTIKDNTVLECMINFDSNYGKYLLIWLLFISPLYLVLIIYLAN